MKHTRLIATALLTLLLASACQQNTTYDEQHVIPSRVWNRYTPQEFEVGVSNTNNYYHIDISVTVDTTLYRYDAFPLMVKMQGPAGETRTFKANIATRQNGHWMGEPAGDTRRTVSMRVKKFFSFNDKGSYRFLIDQATSQYNLEGACGLGLKVSRAKLDTE